MKTDKGIIYAGLLLLIVVGLLMGVAGYFFFTKIVVIPNITNKNGNEISNQGVGTHTYNILSNFSEFDGYTELEQNEKCDSYFGTFYNGEIIPGELAKKVAEKAEDFIKSEVGEDFFKKYYKYECDKPLNSYSSEKFKDLISVPFGIKIINEKLGIDIKETVYVEIEKEKLYLVGGSILLHKSALSNKNWSFQENIENASELWVPKERVLDVLKFQLDGETNKKIEFLNPNEVYIDSVLDYGKRSGEGLVLSWKIILGKKGTDLCSTYYLLARGGVITGEALCPQ